MTFVRRACVGAWVLAACGRGAAPGPVPPEPQPIVPTRPTAPPVRTDDPAAQLEAIESRLEAEDFQLAFSVFASGLLDASLNGELLAQGDRVRLRVTGTFGDREVALTLLGDGDRLRVSDGDRTTIDIAQPPELRRALVIGLVRMGILHNVAVLLGGRPPDHGDGGVADWVQIVEPRAEARVEAGERSEQSEGQPVVSFDLQVAGQAAGEVSLWLDPGARLPRERHQIVRFEEGEMRVREVYRVP